MVKTNYALKITTFENCCTNTNNFNLKAMIKAHTILTKAFCILLVCMFSFTSSYSQSEWITDSLDTFIKRSMQQWQIPGLAVAIVKDGNVVVSKGYGVRENGKPERVDENTLFMIASNTKSFTSTSIALLDYQKRLSLDDKVTRWIPDFKLYDHYATNEVTIRDLLCHRIGLQTFQGDFLNWNSSLSRKELISRFPLHKPVYSFRSQYGYCNLAFVTAGEIIPLVTDTSWDDFLRYHYFVPLKMNRTSTTWNAIANDKNAAKAHTLVNNKLTLVPYANVDNLGPAASINSSVKDMSHWLLMQLDSGRYDNQQIVPYPVLRKTYTSQTIINQLNPSFPSTHFSTYGLGWEMEDYAGRKIIHHGGGADGFVTSTCIVPEEQLGIVILTNSDANWFYDILRKQIIEAYLNEPYRNLSDLYLERYNANKEKTAEELATYKTELAKQNKPTLDLYSYVGDYTNAVYGNMKINNEKGKLILHFQHHPTLTGTLEYLDKEEFLCTYNIPTYGVKKLPFKIVEGKVESITVKVSDFVDYMEYEFKKSIK